MVLELARHAPHRLLEHFADFTRPQMPELVPRELAVVLMISSVEKGSSERTSRS
jgi:hypothetical protein